jgi:hypothetical protein
MAIFGEFPLVGKFIVRKRRKDVDDVEKVTLLCLGSRADTA